MDNRDGGTSGNDWWRHQGTKPEYAPRAELITTQTLVPVVEPAATPEAGSSKEHPILIHSQAQADLLPDGRWVIDSRGTPFQILNHRHPTPIPTPELATTSSTWQQQPHAATFDSEGVRSAIDMIGVGLVACLFLFVAWKIILFKRLQNNPEERRKADEERRKADITAALKSVRLQERKAARAEKWKKLQPVVVAIVLFFVFTGVFHFSPLVAFLIACGIGPIQLFRAGLDIGKK
jgi:hypothetical protein